MIKLVAFDWNGTLFADTYAGYKSNDESFKVINLKPVNFKTFLHLFEVPIKNYYLSLGVSEEEFIKNASKIASAFHTTYEKKAEKVRTRSNTKNLLEWLERNKIEAIIFSNHVEQPLLKQLKRLKIDHFFTKVYANPHREVSLNGRSKKEKLVSYIKVQKLLSDEVLIVGDTVEEIEIGKQLNVTAVAITHGNCSILRLKRAKPDFLISNLKEIIDIIKNKNL